MSEISKLTVTTPIGLLQIIATDKAIVSAKPTDHEENIVGNEAANKLAQECKVELAEYFAGKRQKFDLPLKQEGTQFQKKVWQELKQIPYGETKTYGEIAKLIDKPKASRAIGMANHNNAIMILVPCHRVVGADGSLTGYAYGVKIKKFLLELERKNK
ncbi:methylated-DNA--[protein]-cysteine S-methyltransferase [Lactobacillus johnsonii]|uniref:methylated-DNA--[protein]-cysteine S-methyltransferase n=1 Tax=Lactobacillus johnsonii TaxID=33959 RepID=UPI003F297E28